MASKVFVRNPRDVLEMVSRCVRNAVMCSPMSVRNSDPSSSNQKEMIIIITVFKQILIIELARMVRRIILRVIIVTIM